MVSLYPKIKDKRERQEMGQRITAARESLGLNYTQVGIAVGINGASIREWEHGGPMAERHVEILCQTLGITPEYLFGKPNREISDEEYEKLQALESQKTAYKEREKKAHLGFKLSKTQIKAIEEGPESLSEDETTNLRRWELAQAWMRNGQEKDEGERTQR